MPAKLGRYDLVGVLGSGAMGFVYEAFDPNLGRRVAIKTIKVENLSELAAQEYEARFRTEAQSAARLQHPNIVSVYDSDRDQGVAFLVMEFIDGEDLKRHLGDGRLYSLRETVAIMVALLSALDYAHSQKVIHRDVKPANLLIASNGHVKLTDFGVARIQDSGDATRTQGTVVGTLKYMSPEQIQGLPVDARADIFAAGVILYQLLTGIRPFDAETDFGVIQKIVSLKPEFASTLNRQLPPALDVVVARSLAKSRDDRYSTAAEFSLALSEACRNIEGMDATPLFQSIVSADSSTATNTVHSGNSSSGNATNTLSSSSTVSQEIELVYWKEIRDSNDVEDLDVFLAQFPAGIYAPLAQRRRRQLKDPNSTNTYALAPGGVQPISIMPSTSTLEPHSDGGRQSVGSIPPPDASRLMSQSSQDSTVPIGTSLPSAGNSNAAGDPSNSNVVDARKSTLGTFRKSQGDQSQSLLDQNSAAKRINYRWPIGLAIVALTVVTAFAVLAEKDAPSPQSVQVAAAIATDSVSIRKPPSQPEQTEANPVLKQGSALDGTRVDQTGDRDIKTTLPIPKQASSRASNREKPETVSRPKKPLAEDTVRGREGETDRPSTAAVPEPVAAKPATKSLRQICEDRMLLGYQICMQEQCQKPVFLNHPLCVERRALEQRRRDQEMYR